MKPRKQPQYKPSPKKAAFQTGSGVTLIELMLAMAIISLGILAMIASFQYISVGLSKTRATTIANNLAQQEVETLKNLSYYQLNVTTAQYTNTNYTPNLVYDTSFYPPTSYSQWGMTMTQAVRVDYAGVFGGTISTVSFTTADTGMKQITVYVLWNDSTGYRKVQLTNLYELPTVSSLNGTFTGTVTDANTLAAIAGARVTVINYPNWYGYTNTSGVYSFQVAAGTYSLTCSSAPYYTTYSNSSMNVSNGGSQSWNPTLLKVATGTVASNSIYSYDPSVVISQVVTSTVQANSSYDVEYFELFNGSTSQINIANCIPAGTPPTCTTASRPVQLNIDSTCNGANARTCTNINLVYTSTYIPVGGYYLIANTSTFVLSGSNINADAYYDKTAACTSGGISSTWFPAGAGCTSCKIVHQGHNGDVWLTDASGNYLDSLGWSHTGESGVPDHYEGTYISFPVSSLIQGDQIVRLSNPSIVCSGACSMGNTAIGSAGAMYGRAYDTDDNANNFYANTTGVAAGLLYQTFNRASTIQSIISGRPSTGSYVAANDGFSAAGTSSDGRVTGPQSQSCPISSFTLVGVATGTWQIEIDGVNPVWGVNYSTTISNVVVTQNVTTTIPSATTSPPWTVSGYNYSVLTSTYSGGFVQGYVYGSGSLYSTALNNILMANDQTTRTTRSASSGFYQLLIPTGTVTVYANYNNDNTSYMPSNTVVTASLGQVLSQNFHLPAGAFISGYVTGGSGLGALPNVDVRASISGSSSYSDNTTDSTGHFYILVATSASAYTVAPQLDSSMAYTSVPTSPLTATVTTAGTTIFSGTFTVTGSMANITGSVTQSSAAITTGVLIIASTSAISNPPPTIYAASAAAQVPFYSVASQPNGTYTLPVRISSTSSYNISGFYSSVDPASGSVSYTIKSLSGVNVTSASGASGQNLQW